MAEEKDRSIESRSYSIHFFVVAILLILATFWAIWDEVYTRRPWKLYQRKLNDIEYTKVKAEFDNAESELISKKLDRAKIKGTSVRNMEELERLIDEKIKILEKNEDYKSTLENLKKLEKDEKGIQQDIQFAKSEADEYFYKWKDALRNNKDYKNYRDSWNKTRAFISSMEPKLDDIKKSKAITKQKIQKFQEEIENLKKIKKEITAYRDGLRERLEYIKNRNPYIKQVVIPGLDINNFAEPIARVDRCQSCHTAIDKKGFEGLQQPFASHPRLDPLLTKHPPEKIGCTMCHEGQGNALRNAFQAHGFKNVNIRENGKEVKTKEYLEHWEKPILKGNFIESSCSKCHHIFELGEAKVINKAKLLFTELGCHSCHLTKGFEEKAKIGPDLTRIKSKTYAGWIVNWIKNPHKYLPKTRMPDYKFTEEQAITIGAYLFQNSEPYQFPKKLTGEVSIEKGKELVEGVGCLGCHSIGKKEAGGYMAPLGYDLVPNLNSIARKAKKEWLFNWLKDPKDFRPTTKMPNLRLSDNEALDITAYLLTLGKPDDNPIWNARLANKAVVKQGRKLIYDYGCYSCHDIKGFENASRIAPPLSEFGNKDPKTELYFGDVFLKKDYRKEFDHEIDTWENWTFNKIKNPRTYMDELAESKMPDFGLSDENARTLLVLLKNFTGKIAPEQYRKNLTEIESVIEKGKNIVRTLNCVGCHEIYDKGGDIRKFYEDKILAPPILTGEGNKVQSDWLYRFIKKPTPLRPWLKVRMPTFNISDADINAITAYFTALSKDKIPYSFYDIEGITKESYNEGKRLFGVEGTPEYAQSLKCGSCHPRGGILSRGRPEELGPDLFLAQRRLKPDWIVRWLKNPQALQKGTRMPNFFYDYEEHNGKIEVTKLLENPDEKIRAILDYLMSMKD